MNKKLINEIFDKDKIAVCIIGGGNIGTLLLGELGRKKNISVRLLTSRPEEWNKYIEVFDDCDNIQYTGSFDNISNNPKDVISDCDIIISTVPSNVFPTIITDIKSYIKDGTWIGVIPGMGGSEFICKELIERNCVLFGFQRVHSIARIKKYGQSVYSLGRKSEVKIASIPKKQNSNICKIMGELLDIECIELDNYLNVTLTPSNPILHTSRLYNMFCNDNLSEYKSNNWGFYSEWNDNDSKVLLICDEELQLICNKIKQLNLSEVISLKVHYESNSAYELTKKIKSIRAFKGIKCPMIKDNYGYKIDLNSRYFLEDFPYGLCILKGFAEILNIDTPMIDKILIWYEKVKNANYFIDNKFKGKDLKDLPIPQNYNINSLEEIISYYSR